MPAHWQSPDLDEVRLNQFVINNAKVTPLLRGEGQRDGKFFVLQTQRREGWIARVRMAGFNVRTLQGRVDALRTIAEDVHYGPEGVRALTNPREHIAVWDAQRLRWHDLPILQEQSTPIVRLRINEPVRRRKSRGSGEYFIAVPEHADRINLRPVSETTAILQAYALLASAGRPAILRFTQTDAGYLVPEQQALLPAQHRDALAMLALGDAQPWTFPPETADLAEQVFAKLGVELEPQSRIP